NGFAEAAMIALVLVTAVAAEIPRRLRQTLRISALITLPFTFSRGLLSLLIGWLGVRSRPVPGNNRPRRPFGWGPVAFAASVGTVFVLAIARFWIRWSPARPWVLGLRDQPGSKWQIWE